jgi:hypothetical protein
LAPFSTSGFQKLCVACRQILNFALKSSKAEQDLIRVIVQYLSWSDPMRVAVFVVLVLMVSTPSKASQSCMSKTEARQHLGAVHLYWHGSDRCWDANPGRRRYQAHKVQQIRKVERKIDQPKWYESMSQMLPESQMLPDEQPEKTPWVDRWVDIAPSQRPIVELVEVASAAVIEREPEPMLTPRGVLMAMISIALTLAIVELVFGGMRWAGRMQRN